VRLGSQPLDNRHSDSPGLLLPSNHSKLRSHKGPLVVLVRSESLPSVSQHSDSRHLASHQHWVQRRVRLQPQPQSRTPLEPIHSSRPRNRETTPPRLLRQRRTSPKAPVVRLGDSHSRRSRVEPQQPQILSGNPRERRTLRRHSARRTLSNSPSRHNRQTRSPSPSVKPPPQRRLPRSSLLPSRSRRRHSAVLAPSSPQNSSSSSSSSSSLR
jgi:hypothetical protein